MALIRITIHVDNTENGNSFIHYTKVCKGEDEALQEMNMQLERYELNDGCTMMSSEDMISVNAHLAELFDDPANVDCYAMWEDITEEVQFRICTLFSEHHWSDDALMAMADDMGIDLYDINTEE